jgi:hypothetical protein
MFIRIGDLGINTNAIQYWEDEGDCVVLSIVRETPIGHDRLALSGPGRDAFLDWADDQVVDLGEMV